MTLPTLCFLYAFSGPAFDNARSYAEAFRNPKHFLDLKFRGNPEGILFPSNQSISFSGVFEYDQWEEPVRGTRSAAGGKWVYRFPYSEGNFTGTLTVKNSFPCESVLEYEVHNWGGQTISSGNLRSRNCPRNPQMETPDSREATTTGLQDSDSEKAG